METNGAMPAVHPKFPRVGSVRCNIDWNGSKSIPYLSNGPHANQNEAANAAAKTPETAARI